MLSHDKYDYTGRHFGEWVRGFYFSMVCYKTPEAASNGVVFNPDNKSKGYLEAFQIAVERFKYYRAQICLFTPAFDWDDNVIETVLEGIALGIIHPDAETIHLIKMNTDDEYRSQFELKKQIEFEDALKGHRANAAALAARRLSERAGYVYVVKSGETYKIGKSKDPENRLKTLQTGASHKFEVVAMIETPDCDTLEKQFHKCFIHKRTHGEWFNLTPDDVEFITSRAWEDKWNVSQSA